MNLIKKITSSIDSDVLPLSSIRSALENKTENAIKGLLKRACQKCELIRVRNGLYLVGEEARRAPYHSFQIANFIIEPSYVSLESALSFYGLIPEAVYTTTSVTPTKNLEQETPVGHFSFSYLKSKYFRFGFYQFKDGPHQYLIATPLKALIDYTVQSKKKYKRLSEIEEDLRLDIDEFFSYKKFVNKNKIDEMLQIYKSYRIQVILKDIRKRL